MFNDGRHRLGRGVGGAASAGVGLLERGGMAMPGGGAASVIDRVSLEYPRRATAGSEHLTSPLF